MNRSLVLGGVLAALAFPVCADEHRQLGPHRHGHGKLNIAIENGQVSMDLDVPGADIVGFEHEPNTPEQKTAFEAGKAKLADALSIFKMPAAAGCSVKEAKVSIEGKHETDRDAAPKGETAAVMEAEEHHHADFNVDYTLECKSLARLTDIDFDYFKAFAGAQALEVTVITPKGQNSYEVTRDKPSLDLTGAM